MLTPEQSRGARGLLNWTQQELATAAHLGLSTVKDFESGKRVPGHNNLSAILRALQDAGVEFIPENGGGPGVRLKRKSRTSSRRT
jgi:transcriptional regulator with XRE-family HTH domain